MDNKIYIVYRLGFDWNDLLYISDDRIQAIERCKCFYKLSKNKTDQREDDVKDGIHYYDRFGVYEYNWYTDYYFEDNSRLIFEIGGELVE
jgi:hypothetical protein